LDRTKCLSTSMPFHLGADFTETIKTAISGCDVMLVVIGKVWLAPDSSGRSRLTDPSDFVRIELELAGEHDMRFGPFLLEVLACRLSRNCQNLFQGWYTAKHSGLMKELTSTCTSIV